jgi:pantothenate kinase type III
MGCLRGLAAAIDGICLDMEKQLGRETIRFISGGDSELLMTELRGHYHWHPDLVLRGMAIVADSL